VAISAATCSGSRKGEEHVLPHFAQFVSSCDGIAREFWRSSGSNKKIGHELRLMRDILVCVCVCMGGQGGGGGGGGLFRDGARA
jgi:hypothetical protein